MSTGTVKHASANQPARRLPFGAEVVMATHNKGKLGEFQALLAPAGIKLRSAAALNLPEPEETGATFAQNAAIKALAAAKASGLPALADDSGLCVEALDGAPGIYSARWCGPERDATRAMARVHDEMAAKVAAGAKPDDRATFKVALCLAWPDGTVRHVEGACPGRLCWPPRGDGGHGYDPMFIPLHEPARGASNAAGLTFAEMPAEGKNAFSHRARAVAAFLRACVATESGEGG
ncbi:non-canonical purine NTP pyrophosphatase [Formicincola oecophyllae]|uniref:dITP/XTP pyrophosphatase n=1 Tax=Formicincola oecophyllae TaxID=2558361 RepID=A0A4Y6UAC9_9PROT|nr:non-canonical purine NTP pyrophosphatase [Formicincola oecophyllae]QDH13331.1 non-canonical purine NTP pyrophosphatase [Formicincola oecophyllae]